MFGNSPCISPPTKNCSPCVILLSIMLTFFGGAHIYVITYLHGWLTGLSSILKMCFFGTPLSSPSRAAPSRIALWRRMRGVKGRENSILDHSGLSPLCEYFSTIPSLFLSLPSNHSLILVFPLQSLLTYLIVIIVTCHPFLASPRSFESFS